MPLEINEIDIIMRVGDSAEEMKQNQPNVTTNECGAPDYDAIVADCTRRVLQRLANLQAR
ncbi:MAG: DUF5908 family protein [Cellvibrionaceae bacterium]|nr:DUF5908 family protein [Cellvibrionaceae bacterium]